MNRSSKCTVLYNFLICSSVSQSPPAHNHQYHPRVRRREVPHNFDASARRSSVPSVCRRMMDDHERARSFIRTASMRRLGGMRRRRVSVRRIREAGECSHGDIRFQKMKSRVHGLRKDDNTSINSYLLSV